MLMRMVLFFQVETDHDHIFAYGKVVKLRKGGYRYDWYPKCKLSENSDDISTSEEKANEQTDTIKIKAYPFNEDGDIVAR